MKITILALTMLCYLLFLSRIMIRISSLLLHCVVLVVCLTAVSTNPLRWKVKRSINYEECWKDAILKRDDCFPSAGDETDVGEKYAECTVDFNNDKADCAKEKI